MKILTFIYLLTIISKSNGLITSEVYTTCGCTLKIYRPPVRILDPSIGTVSPPPPPPE